MTRVRVEGRFPQHPKIARAAHALGGVAPLGRVCGVWLFAACHAAARGTDGRVTETALMDPAIDRAPAEVIAALITGGLLDLTDEPGVYQIHDFDVYNGTEAQAATRVIAAKAAGRASVRKRTSAVAIVDGPEALRALWNKLAVPPIAHCTVITPKRRSAALQRLKELPLPEWEAVIGRVMASEFCRGGGTTRWVASFDWLLRPDSAVKVLEGKYERVQRPLSREERIREAADRAVASLKRGEW